MAEQLLFDECRITKLMRVAHIERGEDGLPKFIFELYVANTLHAKIETDQIQFDEFMVNFIKSKLQCSCKHKEEDKCQE